MNLPLTPFVASGVKDAIDKLKKHGLVILEPTMDSKTLESLDYQMREISESLESKSESQFSYQVAKGETNVKLLREADTAVLNRRGGEDDGMLDLWHLDKLSPEGNVLKNALEALGVKDIMEACSGKKMKFMNFNAYINKNVTKTRGLHVDSYGVNQFKVFVYLTDVLEMADGPYCYGVESHLEPELEHVNRFLTRRLGRSETDVVLVNQSMVHPLLAKKGTVIISNQSGAHRGYPQQAGHFRALAMMSFTNT
jgi:hypothetical protein